MQAAANASRMIIQFWVPAYAPQYMIKSWSQVICSVINILTQIHAIIYVIKYFDIQINLPLLVFRGCRINKGERRNQRCKSKIYGRCVDDRSRSRSREKAKPQKGKRAKSDRKRNFLIYQIYWLQVAHTGDYLLNDCKKVQRYRITLSCQWGFSGAQRI